MKNIPGEVKPENFKFAKRKLRVCVCLWTCECASRYPRRSERPFSLNTELQMTLSCQVWMLGTELKSYEGAATALTTEPPTSPFPFNSHNFHSAQEFLQMSHDYCMDCALWIPLECRLFIMGLPCIFSKSTLLSHLSCQS